VASESDIEDWINKVKRAESAQDVLHILDQFRPLAWSNQERSAMAHAYLRVLEKMPKANEAVAPLSKDSNASGTATNATADNVSAQQGDGNDGAVWYEKM
jgi:hypothetical protein